MTQPVLINGKIGSDQSKAAIYTFSKSKTIPAAEGRTLRSLSGASPCKFRSLLSCLALSTQIWLLYLQGILSDIH